MICIIHSWLVLIYRDIIGWGIVGTRRKRRAMETEICPTIWELLIDLTKGRFCPCDMPKCDFPSYADVSRRARGRYEDFFICAIAEKLMFLTDWQGVENSVGVSTKFPSGVATGGCCMCRSRFALIGAWWHSDHLCG